MPERQPREAQVEANGIRIRYLDWEGSSPPIVLLHNNRGVADPWQRFVAVSPLTNRFVAPDQRGCGTTDKPPTGYSVWDLAADVAGLIEALGLGKVPVVGCAIGGSIGLALAARRPDLVSALVMLDSGFPISPEIIERSVTILKYVPQTFDSRREARIFARALPSSLGYNWTPIFDQYFDWTFRDEPDGRCSFRYDKQAMLQATGHLADDLWEDAARVECPVLVSVAGESGIIAEDGARKLAEVIPQGSFLALEGTRHLVFLEEDLRPVEKITREYLERVGALGATAGAST